MTSEKYKLRKTRGNLKFMLQAEKQHADTATIKNKRADPGKGKESDLQCYHGI